MARDGTKIAMLTAYDASFAAVAERAGIDVLLVGDSLGMVIQGHASTLPVTLADVVYHTRCVAAGCRRPLIVADLPFGSYQESPAQAYAASVAALQAGAQMVKLEGGAWLAPTVEFLTARGVPVCGHVGLQPQSVNTLGGYRVQGKTADAAAALLADAEALVSAGASLLVVECVPQRAGRGADARGGRAGHRHRRRPGMFRAGAGHVRCARNPAGARGALRPQFHVRRGQRGSGARRVRRSREGRLLPRPGALLLRQRPATGSGRKAVVSPEQRTQGRHSMHIATTAAELSTYVARDKRVAFVATMGNLHSGHLSLMEIARKHGDIVVASIFVNRLQFGPNEDFDRYPRTIDADRAGLERIGVDVLFAPLEHEMYPTPQVYRVQPPPLADELEGASRPGFFHGVCTVVLKLFNLVQPDVAVFGKKDRQQLKIVRGMVQQFNMPIQIVPAETIRADDGLALSSRNNYLSPAERAEAPNLYRVLRGVADEILKGRHDYANLEAAARAELARRGWKVDYIAIRHGLGMRIPHPEGYDHPNLLIVLGAATQGSTRLIDNVDVIPKDGED